MQHEDCPHHTAQNIISNVRNHQVVNVEECSRCFETQGNKEGITLCLRCLAPTCPLHSMQHSNLLKHPLAINFKLKPQHEQEKQGDYEIEYTTEVLCLECNKKLDPFKFRNIIDRIISKALPEPAQNMEQEWAIDMRPCPHTTTLTQINQHQLTDDKLSHCSQCDLKTNLWLCLICGSLGCGRQNFDGTGGRGHAKAHYSKTGHTVAVKLGTITQEGDASIHCYGCDDEVADDDLAEHLATFGINIANVKKTEKTIEETVRLFKSFKTVQNLSLNVTLDPSKVLGINQGIKPVFGKGYTGFQRIGST